MNSGPLLAHFERVSNSPDAVPRLRTLILDLAVRGKLLPQNPNDEPVFDLLKRIEGEDARRCKEAKIPRGSRLPPLTLNEFPFEIPGSWKWLRLAELGFTQTGTTPPSNNPEYFGDYIPFVKPADLTGSTINYSGEGISKQGVQHSRLIPRNSVLMVCIGSSIGKVNVADRDVCCNQQINTVSPYFESLGKFTSFALKASYFQELVRAKAGVGTLPIISKRKWEVLPVPLPPLGEQRRIIAKVDELMALCDRLEIVQRERDVRRDRLTSASHYHLSNGADKKAFREHAHFYINHLPTLTTRVDHIKQLRQTVFDLAVRGKLVPQDLANEPVSGLLKRINEYNVSAIKERRLRREIRISPLSAESTPFELPRNWIWVPFGQIMISRDGERIPISREERNSRGKTYDYYGASGVIDKIDGYLFDKPLLLIGEDGANLINRSTPIAFIARGKYWVNNHAHVLDGISEGFLRFIELYINAIDLRPYVTGTAQPKMNQAKMNSIPIALPPEDEQLRIVAKVDELMSICDLLERRLSDAQTECRNLLEAILHHALNGVAEIGEHRGIAVLDTLVAGVAERI